MVTTPRKNLVAVASSGRREEQWVKEDKEEEEEVEVRLLGGERRSGKGS